MASERNINAIKLITNKPKLIIDVETEYGIMQSGEQTVLNILFILNC